MQGIEGNQSRTEEKPKLKKPLKKMGVERWVAGVKTEKKKKTSTPDSVRGRVHFACFALHKSFKSNQNQ